jgi:hypothetical protein
MKEVELAEKIIEWLQEQNWTIYQEVEFRRLGGRADIVAERHGILWIVETKMAMSLDVLNQATTWPTHYRSVGVPSAKRSSHRDYRVAKDYYGVGVLEVGKGGMVTEVVKAPLFLKNDKVAKGMISQLKEQHKTFAKAGSNGGGYYTPYRNTMVTIREIVRKNPGCTVDEVFEICGKMHYASKGSFKGNALKCLDSFEKDWCRIDKSSFPYRLYLV